MSPGDVEAWLEAYDRTYNNNNNITTTGDNSQSSIF